MAMPGVRQTICRTANLEKIGPNVLLVESGPMKNAQQATTNISGTIACLIKTKQFIASSLFVSLDCV